MYAKIVNIVGVKSFRIIGYYVLTMLLAYNAGLEKAESAKEYYVMADSPSVIVLKIYSYTLICIFYDVKTKEIKDTFMIYKLVPKEKYEFVRQNIGPLNFEKTKKEKANPIISLSS